LCAAVAGTNDQEAKEDDERIHAFEISPEMPRAQRILRLNTGVATTGETH
jgi:hypothetical protein